MKLRKDPSGAIELLLWDMPAADIERITKTVLSEVESSGPVSITHIAGDAVNCAIGTGASLTARDLLAVLDGRGDNDPLVRELLVRLSRLQSLDAELPERRSATQEAEEEAGRAAAKFTRELSARNLADPQSADFGRTKYAKRLGFPDERQQIVPIRTVGTFFALAPAPLIADAAKQQFLRWMDCNQRRYPPIDDCFFLPGPMPDLISRAHVWHNGHRNRFFPMVASYTTYIAVELEEGYMEYGFCPGSFFEPDKEMVYYAKVVGGFVAFLGFLRHLSETFGGDSSTISVGFAMRGTADTRLRCITKRVMEHHLCSATPEQDGFRWVNAATPGTDWSLDRLARHAALDLLDHWSYTGPAWAGTPEFTDGKYTGDYFRSDFHGQW